MTVRVNTLMRVAAKFQNGTCALALLVASACADAADGDYPNKPIRVIVPFATGIDHIRIAPSAIA